MRFFFPASSKHKLIELEQQVTNLTDKLVESDQEKEQLKLELRSANISLQDVQQRLHTLQVKYKKLDRCQGTPGWHEVPFD